MLTPISTGEIINSPKPLTRAIAPLTKAVDAVEIVTDGLSWVKY